MATSPNSSRSAVAVPGISLLAVGFAVYKIEEEAHLEQGLDDAGVLRSETHVESGRQLQRIQVPAAG